jgi:hypothetical protein
VDGVDIQTIQQVATICAKIADDNKGFLQIGDIIRKQFHLSDPTLVVEKIKTSRLQRIK